MYKTNNCIQPSESMSSSVIPRDENVDVRCALFTVMKVNDLNGRSILFDGGSVIIRKYIRKAI